MGRRCLGGGPRGGARALGLLRTCAVGERQSVREPERDPPVPGHDDPARVPQRGRRGGDAVGVPKVDDAGVLRRLLFRAARPRREQALRDSAGRRDEDVEPQPRPFFFSSFFFCRRAQQPHLELLGLEVDAHGLAADDGEVGRGEGRGLHGGD